MSATPVLDAWIEAHQSKDQLHFLACGSVDDGKSTLIGRLLYDTELIPEDQLAAVAKDSERYGTTGKNAIDLALLTDGLKAEREQGITIDVAYRYFSTAKRTFIIADCPGHTQYTRNMATGASTCQLAVILVDARQGVQEQTWRHAYIVSLFGIRQVVVAINKMDLVGWDPGVFAHVQAEFTAFASRLDLPNLQFIPLSALTGDNVVRRGGTPSWYQGRTLLEHLESAPVNSGINTADFRFPVQLTLRPHPDFRGIAGTVHSGMVRVGDEVVNLPSKRHARVKSIFVAGEVATAAFAPQAVVITLDDAIDCSRGDLLAHPANPPLLATRIEAMLVWMHEEELVVSRPYWVRMPCGYVLGIVTAIHHTIDIRTLEQSPATTVSLNVIARVNIALSRPLPVDPYVRNHATGSFVLIDRGSNATVGAGTILSAEDITRGDQSHPLGQSGGVVWLTGLSGAGKSTIANELRRLLCREGRFAHVLDGDQLRRGLCHDLGFSADDRSENIRRIAEVARLFADAGAVAIVACISPYRADRIGARAIAGDHPFLEVHVATSLAECERRDSKGLYRRARSGEIRGVTGIDDPYEVPEAPDLRLDTVGQNSADCAGQLLTELRRWQFPAQADEVDGSGI